MSKQKIVLQRDVYDALELSALIHGGIGSGCLTKDENSAYDTPSCIIGHALFLDGYEYRESAIVQGSSPVCDELVQAFPALVDEIEDAQIYHNVVCAIESENDTTVNEYSTNLEETLTWKQWTKRMRVVRGDN